MLLEVIKTQTSINHLLLKKMLISLIRTIRTETDNARFLALFHGYFEHLNYQSIIVSMFHLFSIMKADVRLKH